MTRDAGVSMKAHLQNRSPLAVTGVQFMQAMNHIIPNPQCHEADGVSLDLMLGPDPTRLDGATGET